MLLRNNEENLGEKRKTLVELQIEAIFHPEMKNEWMSFVNKSKQLSSQWKSNEAWPYECYAATRKAFELIHQKNKQISSRELSEFLAKQRHEIAEKFDEEWKEAFGRFRDPDMLLKDIETPIIPPRYTDFVGELTETYKNLIAAPDPDENYSKLKKEYLRVEAELNKPVNPDEDQFERQKRISLILKQTQSIENDIKKSGYHYLVDSDGRLSIFYQGTKYSTLEINEKGQLNIVHAVAESIPEAFDHIEPIFQKVLNAKKPTTEEEFKELIQDIGFIAWHHFQAMPYSRGNAAITEMMIRSLMMVHDIKLPTYNQSIICDLRAIFEPDVNQFREKFYHYFDWPKEFAQRFYQKGEKIPDREVLFTSLEDFFRDENTKSEDCFAAFNYLMSHHQSLFEQHKNPTVDRLFSIKYPAHFQNLWKNLAEITMQKLRQEVFQSDADVGWKLMERAKNERLFKEHPGQFGFLRQTPWIKEIEKMQQQPMWRHFGR